MLNRSCRFTLLSWLVSPVVVVLPKLFLISWRSRWFTILSPLASPGTGGSGFV